MKILHVITTLEMGGAQTMLRRLIESDPTSIPDTVVVSLTSVGVIGEALRTQNVTVHALEMSSVLSFPGAFRHLFKLIRQYQPNIVQTWMYHSDLLGGLAARLAGCHCIVWGIHCTILVRGFLSATFWLVRLNAILSRVIPHRIICCAKSTKELHIKLGYSEQKMIVINNGYDFPAFDRYLNSRTQARMELGIDDNEIVIGAVGRFDPLKDFHNFVLAASKLVDKRDNVKFLMIGFNLEWSNDTLRSWIEEVGLVKNFKLIGEQAEILYFFSAMDVFCLSSCGEAFPNVVIEAMAMGVPCVVTRVGDAAEMIGDEDFVVPAKDSTALAEALLRMCELSPESRLSLGKKGSKKVRAEYDIKNIRQKYENLYMEIANK